MFMNSLIHLLEVMTLILVGVLIVQVYRCYLNFTRAEQAQGELAQVEAAARSMRVRINISSSARTKNLPLKQGTSHASKHLETKGKATETLGIEALPQEAVAGTGTNRESMHSNGQILNDYIGEFFAEPMPADIGACKRESSDEASIESAAVTPAESPVVKSEAPREQDKDEVIVVESDTRIQAVILESEELDLDSLPILTEIASIAEEPGQSEEDSIIMVMSGNDSQQANAKVMSDKVVHAMLDEARLVCTS